MAIANNSFLAATLATSAFAVFALADAFTKLLCQRYSVPQVTVMVTVVALLIVIMPALAKGRAADIFPRYPAFALTRALLYATDTILIYYAFAHLPLANVYVVTFLNPVLVTVLAFVFLKERLSLVATGGVILGFIGVLVSLKPGAVPLGLGHLAAFGAICLFAVTILMLRRAKADESDLALVTSTLAVLSVLALVMVMLSGGFTAVALIDLLLVVVASLCVAAGNMLMVRAFRLGNAGMVAPFQYSQIIWGGLLGYFMFADTLEFATLAGAAIIIISGWLVLK